MKFLFMLLLFCCCTKQGVETFGKAGQFFVGNHTLMSLSTYTSNETTTRAFGSFFVLVGGFDFSQDTKKAAVARFVWRNNKGEGVISELPLNKVRFVIDNSITEPYCKFRWVGEENRQFSETYWEAYVIYVVLVLKEDQIKNQTIEFDLKPN